jgi:hypothetical protein
MEDEMEPTELEARNAFLIAAIEDLRDSIRAMDFKAEVLLIAMSAPLMDASGTAAAIVGLVHLGNPVIAALSTGAAAVLVGGWFVAFCLILRLLLAGLNPAAAVPDHSQAKDVFFPAALFRVRKRDLLRPHRVVTSKSVQDHLDDMPASLEEIAIELTFEQMKLAFLFAIKRRIFNCSVVCVAAGVAAGCILFGFHAFW